MTIIRRRTSGGTLELADRADDAQTCGCGRVGGRDGDRLIGVHSEVAAGPHDGRSIDFSICPDCLATAIAVHLGRRHVLEGGDLADLDPDAPA